MYVCEYVCVTIISVFDNKYIVYYKVINKNLREVCNTSSIKIHEVHSNYVGDI